MMMMMMMVVMVMVLLMVVVMMVVGAVLAGIREVQARVVYDSERHVTFVNGQVCAVCHGYSFRMLPCVF